MPVASKRSNPKINRALVVSPYGIVQAMLKIHVSKHDVSTDRCSSMNDALIKLKRDEYDMVVLEIVKENILDGSMKERIRTFVTAFRALLKREERETAIVVLSAQSHDEFLKEYDVDVDCILDKRADWYDKLSNFICPPQERGMVMPSEQAVAEVEDEMDEDALEVQPEITIDPQPKKERSNFEHQEIL